MGSTHGQNMDTPPHKQINARPHIQHKHSQDDPRRREHPQPIQTTTYTKRKTTQHKNNPKNKRNGSQY
jgi:hypothetical protein